MYNRPINYELQWCVSGVSNAPSQEKIRYGWNGSEKPMVENLNWMMNRIDGAIGYFLQGVSRWGEEVDYSAGDIINYNGSLFVCILEHTNKPISDEEYWKEAFLSSTNGESLAEEIRKIKEVDGYLSKYLKISDPVTPNRVRAGSYSAKVGLPTTVSYNVGYSFEGANTTGMYNFDGVIQFRVAGNTRAIIPNAIPTLEDESNSIATTEWVQKLIESKIGNIDMDASRLPVGSIYFSANEQNPNATLGYGTWIRFAEGQVIVGKSVTLEHPSWTKEVYNKTGEYTHQLTNEELPSSGGSADRKQVFASGGSYAGDSGRNGGMALWNVSLGDAGISSVRDKPHNNVQPSIVVNIWRRTA